MYFEYNYLAQNNTDEHTLKYVICGIDFNIKCEFEYFTLVNGDSRIIIEGDLFYYYDQEIEEYFYNKSYDFVQTFLTKIINTYGWEYCRNHLEGEFLTIVIKKNSFRIESDKLRRKRIFYSYTKNGIIGSSNVNTIVKKTNNSNYNQNVLASILISHYQYTPSKHTIYSNIYSLCSDEYINYNGDTFEINNYLQINTIEEYNNTHLQEYSRLFDRAILGRADKSFNIANSTGGWDSTIIIDRLIELIGKNNFLTCIYNFIYTDKREWNVYEKERAQKIAKHYELRFEEIPIELDSPSLLDGFDELIPLLYSNHIYGGIVGAFAHYFTYKQLNLKQFSGKIFSGEASDSIHNFGFSQYIPFFHESYAFKEYGDKMKNYLFSPVFFEKVLKGDFIDDVAFQIWMFLSKKVSIKKYNSGQLKDKIFDYIVPLIYSQHSRIPFEIVFDNDILTDMGRQDLIKYLKDFYFNNIIEKINQENFYSSCTLLYKYFHLQSPTIHMIPLSASLNGFKTGLPFLDTNLIKFTEKMPMNWGRGLEFNNTKYPLKMIAKLKDTFPVKIVEEGIHSYPTEVDRNFKPVPYHFYFNSVFTKLFKEKMSTYKYKEILDNRYFNLKQINSDVDAFLNNKVDSIKDYNSLIRLINFVTIGWK